MSQSRKWCSRCERWLPRAEFHHNRSTKDGLAHWCKDCSRESAERRDNSPQYNGELKQCARCGEWKDKTEFYCHRRRSDGLHSWCKSCMQEAKYEHQRTNRDEYNAYQRQYYAENKEKYQEYSRRAYEERGDELRARSRDYCREHAEANRDRAIQWAKDNPDARKAILQRRRANKLGAEGSFTAKQWEELCAKYGYRCACCGERKPLTVDHIVPLSKGGSNFLENVQPLCRSCNASKGTKTMDYRPASILPEPQSLVYDERLIPIPIGLEHGGRRSP